MKVPFLRGGRKEAVQGLVIGSLPKVEVDPYASIVSFYAEGKQPMAEIGKAVAEQYPDP